MYRLFETICIRDGAPMHLEWHARRMKNALFETGAGGIIPDLAKEVFVPPGFAEGVVRCNMEYGPEGVSVRFSRYEKRIIHSLQIVHCDTIDYRLKYLDRALLNELFSRRGQCDEIIIVKYGLITDTSMSNLVFYKGDRGFTPSAPLLRGTCRERLLASGEISEALIRPEDLPNYDGVKLINAMREPAGEHLIPVSMILSLPYDPYSK
jgi:4-amino-4-deoxychorismate lyase